MGIVKDFFVYQASFASIAPAAVSSANISIQADSDFELIKMMYASNVNAAVQTESSRSIPKCTILITDTGSGRQLMNGAVDITTLFGDGREPFILPMPKLFRANTTIAIDVTNYSATETYNVRLSLVGHKIYGTR